MNGNARAIPILALAAACAGGCEQAGRDRVHVYPDRPIRLIVPFAPGGSTDTLARIYKKAIEDSGLLPVPLVIVNVDGAGGTIGSRRAKNAPPDGYTILLLHQAILTARHSGKVLYGPEAFTAIAGTGQSQLIIATASESRFRDLRDALERAADRPDTLTFGANLGAPSHFVARQLEGIVPGARFRFVQTGGGARRFAALQGRHIELSIFSVDEFLRFRAAGLRALAVLGERRHPALPDVATAREQRVEIESSNMHFWWAPRGTPAERVEVLLTALRQAGETDYVRSKMADLHCQAIFLGGEALAERLATLEAELSGLAPAQSPALPDFAAIALVVTLLLSVPTVVGVRRSWNRSATPAAAKTKPRFDLAILCGALTLAYVAAIGMSVSPFRGATTVFVLGMGFILGARQLRAVSVLFAIALAMGFGLDYVFSNLLSIDLP